jgi:hypothetical protein
MAYEYEKSQGILSAANADTSSVSDMLSKNGYSISKTPSDDKTINSNKSISNFKVLNKSTEAIKKPKTFISQASRTTIDEISFEELDTATDEVDILSDAQKQALSEYTGIDITNNEDLEKARETLKEDIKYMSAVGVDLDTLPTIDAEEDLILKENKFSLETLSELAKKVPKLGIDVALGDLDLSKDIPMIADELGNPIDGIPTELGYDTVKEMSDRAKSICSGSGLDISDFGKNLGLFDALLSLASDMGLTQLLKNLANCLNFFDFNGEDILSKKLPSVIKNGDYKTADTIVDLIGKDKLKDPIGSVKDLISKIPGTEEEPLPYVQHLMDNASVANKDIYTSPVDNYGFECDEDLTAITVTNSSDFSNNDTIRQGILGEDAELIGSNPFSEPEELVTDSTSFSNQMW